MTEIANKSILNSRVKLFGLSVLIIASTIAIITINSFGFHINRLTGVSYASALAGLKLSLKAYRAGKGIRRALTVAFSWTVISVLISALGDAAVGYLLQNHITQLAHW